MPLVDTGVRPTQWPAASSCPLIAAFRTCRAAPFRRCSLLLTLFCRRPRAPAGGWLVTVGGAGSAPPASGTCRCAVPLHDADLLRREVDFGDAGILPPAGVRRLRAARAADR